MPGRGPVTEVLARGDDDGPAPDERGLLARLFDWWVERPQPPRGAVAVGLLVTATLAAGVVVVARHDPPSPAPSPAPVPAEVLERRRRGELRAARFAGSQQCRDRQSATYQVVSHAPDWTQVRYEVAVAAGTPGEGRLLLDIQPSDIALAYTVVTASGTCRR